MNIQHIWNNWQDKENFSGVFSASCANENNPIFEKQCGFRNRNENLPNNKNTAFGIASGTKLFTGLAVCKLIDEGKLNLNDRLADILLYDLGLINKDVTLFHLLTHTSGIGDYIDEEAPDSTAQMEMLYHQYPVYLWENLEYYLKMITPLPQKFNPGERFGYSNAGFILLGLAIEAISKISYQQYVTENIISPLKLNHTGFYRMDNLPENTALGYIYNDTNKQWHTNIFKIPVLGGSDGGLYTCAQDLEKLWLGIFSHRIISEKMLREFLKNQIYRSQNKSYGLGVYRYCAKEKIAYYAVGGDYGVDFFTVYIPEEQITISALGNTETNTEPLLTAILSAL